MNFKLFKADGGKPGKVLKDILVKRGGKTFRRKQWVRVKDDSEGDDKSSGGLTKSETATAYKNVIRMVVNNSVDGMDKFRLAFLLDDSVTQSIKKDLIPRLLNARKDSQELRGKGKVVPANAFSLFDQAQFLPELKPSFKKSIREWAQNAAPAIQAALEREVNSEIEREYKISKDFRANVLKPASLKYADFPESVKANFETEFLYMAQMAIPHNYAMFTQAVASAKKKME